MIWKISKCFDQKKPIFCIFVEFLIYHKTPTYFAIKIITDENKFDANIILIYVKMYFTKKPVSSVGEKEYQSLNPYNLYQGFKRNQIK